MIKQGKVRIDNVGEKFQSHQLGPGDYFGERALMTNEPRAATVIAVTKTVLMTLDKIAFQKHLGPLQDVLDQNLNMRVLNSVKLFEKLTAGERAKLCKSFVSEVFSAQSTIIKQGDKGTKFYVLLDGTATVYDKENQIGVLKSGDYFGEMALLDDETRKATIIANTDCKCVYIDRNTFTKILGSLKHLMERETMARLEALERSSQYDMSEYLVENSSVSVNTYQLTNLVHIAMLGSGTFGRVTLVQDKVSKTLFALKAMFKSEIVAHKQQTNVMNEKMVMTTCSHPFILKLFQTFKDNKRLYMLLEFIQGGELFSVIHKSDRDGIPDYHSKFYACGILLALAHLHRKDIAYRDMKPENCLIDKEGYPKMVDFGFAKVIPGKSYTLCGTPEYLSPELVLGRGHNKAVDYWALGILIYEMICGYSPFSDPTGNMDQVVICKNIVAGKLRFDRNFNSESQVI
jgi:cGMP-dependent protein kinase